MGGVGKTELATQYARRHEADYPGGICWLTSRESNLANQIVQFFLLHIKINKEESKEFNQIRRDQTLKEQLEWCYQHWQPSEGLVLVVLDDVMDLGSCRGMLPTANRFRVLVTTRLRRLDTNFFELPLDVLSLEEALELLAALESEERVKCEHQVAEELCEWLGYLPLGLELVGRYLAEDPDLSLAEMLERLKALQLQDEALDRSEQQMQQTFSTAPCGVRAAFELSWREINQISQRIGQLLSLFKITAIPWELVTFTNETQSLGWTKTEINSAKKQLYKLSLIQKIEDNKSYYKIHPLLRDFFQAKLAASEQANDRITFTAAVWSFSEELADTVLDNLNETIEKQVAEKFKQLEFDEDWNPEDCMESFLEDIEVTVDSIKITQKELLDVDKNLFNCELISEIVFTPEGSYPDLDMCYRDPDDGDWVCLKTITEIEDKNTATITVKVQIVFDENDPYINEVELVVKEPIKFDRRPIESYSDWDEFSSDWEE